MKKLRILAVFVLVLTLAQAVSANMAAPQEPDVGSAVTFEKNEEIAVLSEVLDITVRGALADITAAYRMKNTTDAPVSTPAMFLSPRIAEAGVQVTVDGTPVSCTSETWHLEYDSQVTAQDWRYAVLHPTDRTESQDWQPSCDTVTFTLDFAPGEEYDVTVSYVYALGGYPDYDFDAKDGILEYYLTPAAMWKDFENLTINLTLDKDMPKLVQSSVDFEKVGERQYRYVSDTLPAENLTIRIDENWIQNIASTLRSPYLVMNLMLLAPLLVPVLAVIVIIVVVIVKRRRRAKEATRADE